VRGRGRILGAFVLTPMPAVPISPERCVVAVAPADQLGSALSPRLDPILLVIRRIGTTGRIEGLKR
jgi:hypothetical protein